MNNETIKSVISTAAIVIIIPLASKIIPLVLGFCFIAAPFFIVWEFFKGIIRHIVRTMPQED